jgi:hypothetical protein
MHSAKARRHAGLRQQNQRADLRASERVVGKDEYNGGSKKDAWAKPINISL